MQMAVNDSSIRSCKSSSSSAIHSPKSGSRYWTCIGQEQPNSQARSQSSAKQNSGVQTSPVARSWTLSAASTATRMVATLQPTNGTRHVHLQNRSVKYRSNDATTVLNNVVVCVVITAVRRQRRHSASAMAQKQQLGL